MLTTPLRIVTMALLSFFIPLLLVVCLGTGRASSASKTKPSGKAEVKHLVFAPRKAK